MERTLVKFKLHISVPINISKLPFYIVAFSKSKLTYCIKRVNLFTFAKHNDKNGWFEMFESDLS